MTEKPKPIKIARYASGIEQRAAKAREDRPKMGNLAQADAAYKPGRDGPMTIGNLTESQRRAESGGETGGLSQKTMDAMGAVARATEAARKAKEGQTPPVPKPAPPQPKKEPIKMSDEKTAPKLEDNEETKKAREKKAKEQLDQMDDFEIERLMRGIQKDVIDNDKERAAVNDKANNRCTEIDFPEGVASGEFKQIVDVVPGRLKVHYRTITPMENQGIRLWIFRKATEDPRLDRVSGEMFGIGLVVAAVQQINAKAFPDHLKRNGQGVYGATFDEEVFGEKYDQFSRMPQPLIHAIGVHSQWFDLRVREMFTADSAKNG